MALAVQKAEHHNFFALIPISRSLIFLCIQLSSLKEASVYNT